MLARVNNNREVYVEPRIVYRAPPRPVPAPRDHFSPPGTDDPPADPLPLESVFRAARRYGIWSKRSAFDSRGGMPPRASQLFERCCSEAGDRKDETVRYCNRVAWSVFCAIIDPYHTRCADLRRHWGGPYQTSLQL